MDRPAARPPRVSVLMPTYAQAPFVARAIDSVLAQSFPEWELYVVDDGSPDDTVGVVKPFLADARIRYDRLPRNVGLGAALNHALARTSAPLVAYLPSDDVYYRDHLASLVALLDAHPQAALAYSGVRHHYNRIADGQIPDEPLQLVQVMHRRTTDRWTERAELVTDDLGRMLWDKLRAHGRVLSSGRVTCEWVAHAGQRHRVLREPIGGVNAYRSRFAVPDPLRFHSTRGHAIDEVARYARFRDRPDTPPAADGLRILLVGELAYNAERVLALEERGHRLYGLWLDEPHWYNTVGPVPFGHVTDLPRAGWQDAMRSVRPDVIYALLNWQAVPLAHHVLTENPGVPFVWHFKEGPFICLDRGTWPQLLDLYRQSDAQIYCSPEMRDWFFTVAPDLADAPWTLVLDGDLPKADWLDGTPRPRLSQRDGELHTIVPGRPIGLHPHDVATLAAQRIHLHFYGDVMHGLWRDWLAEVMPLADGYVHLHGHVEPDGWVEEFSRYDAGWLHFFESRNAGELRRADWDDLNYPARLSALVFAGVPLIQRDNPGSVVATQSLVRQRDMGLFADDVGALGPLLRDASRMAQLRGNVSRQRADFAFDTHAETLVGLFRQVIASRG